VVWVSGIDGPPLRELLRARNSAENISTKAPLSLPGTLRTAAQ
jgi:hypothetical protein